MAQRPERRKLRGLGGPAKTKRREGPGMSHHQFSFHRSKGQHILSNPLILNSMVDKANIKRTDVVLEIGPGTGNLTVRLLERAKKVIACEIDPRMVAELKKRVQGTPYQNKLEILVGDIIKIEWPYFDVCVANLPYQVSSPFVFKLLSGRMFRSAIVMFQKEFAERLIAKPGSNMYGRLSVNVQLLAKTSLAIKVGRNNFRPPPKVDSSIVKIFPHNPRPQIDFREWDGMARVCFSRKNKTLASLFKQRGVLEMLERNRKTVFAVRGETVPEGDTKEMVMQLLEQGGFAQWRASKLDIDQFLELLVALNKEHWHFA